MAKLSREELAEIKERIGRVSFDSAYVKGDPWKGYEVKDVNTGIVLAEVSAGYDAEYIAYSRIDILCLLEMVEEMQWEIEQLEKEAEFLNCLEACGVDNWSGYSDAREMMEEDSE